MARPSATTERIAGADGLTLALDRTNAGAASSVVLLHGGGQTRQAWRTVHADLAAAGHEVIALDQRGHGESDWSPKGAYTFHDYAADLEAVVATLATRPVLVGASLGGIASMVAIGLHQLAAAGLVLVDITTRPRAAGTSRIHEFMTATEDGFADLDEAALAISTHLPGRPGRGPSDGLKRNLRLRPDGRWYWHWDPRILEHGPDEYGAQEAAELEQATRRITIPTLLIWGADSDVVTAEEAAHFQGLVPHAEVRSIPQAHHMVTGDRNDIFGALIVEFVARITSVSG